jgi:hypothetical protein
MKILVEVLKERDQLRDLVRDGARELKQKLKILRCKDLTDLEKSLETATTILCNHPNTSS